MQRRLKISPVGRDDVPVLHGFEYAFIRVYLRLFVYFVYLRKKYFSFLYLRVPGRLQALYC